MPEPVDITTAVATELVKQLPLKDAYSDGLSPGVKQVGGALEDITKTLRLALAPFQVGAALQDRLTHFINKSIREVPESRRVAPPPQILGPTIEAIKYEPEDSSVDRMFSELLKKSMDSERVHLAHPSYPQVIRNLSPDEGALLNEIYRFQEAGNPAKRRLTLDLNLPSPPYWKNETIEIDEISKDILHFPQNFDFYFQHLHAMGLASIYKVHEETTTLPDNTQKGVRIHQEYKLEAFGYSFMKAVTKETS